MILKAYTRVDIPSEAPLFTNSSALCIMHSLHVPSLGDLVFVSSLVFLFLLLVSCKKLDLLFVTPILGKADHFLITGF